MSGVRVDAPSLIEIDNVNLANARSHRGEPRGGFPERFECQGRGLGPMGRDGHIERCRLGKTRTVPVELIVNGQVAATKNITADGKTQPLSFDIPIKQSSWVAVRILPSVHTNPIWVEVGGQPVRASKKSIDWCKQAVEVCWNAKKNQIREPERATAKAAYDEAAKIYEARMKETVAE